MAMVSDSGLGKILMNVLFAFEPLAIPMKTFSDAEAARQSLKPFLP